MEIKFINKESELSSEDKAILNREPHLKLSNINAVKDYKEVIKNCKAEGRLSIILDFLPPFTGKISMREILQYILTDQYFEEAVVIVANKFVEDTLINKINTYTFRSKSYNYTSSGVNGEIKKMLTITCMTGNIVEVSSDVLVNPTSILLKLGGGVAGAVRKVVNPGLKDEMEKIRETDFKFNAGDAFHTSAYNLPFNGIIHVITKPCGNEVDLANAVKNILNICDKEKYESISMPLLATGNSQLSLETFLKGFEDGVGEYYKNSSAVKYIKLVHPSHFIIDKLIRHFDSINLLL